MPASITVPLPEMKYSSTPLRQIARLYEAVLGMSSATSQLVESQDRIVASLHDRLLKTDLLGQHTERAAVDCFDAEPLLRSLLDRADFLCDRQAAQARQGVCQELAQLRTSIAIKQPDNVVINGWSAYSQCDEDGIVRECLRRIGGATPLSRTFIEVGCADGRENNTHQLLLDGFRGCWLDGDADKIHFIEGEIGSLRTSLLRVECAFASLDNIETLVAGFLDHLGTRDVDFLSLDVDGNDIHLMKASLQLFEPKLLCVEYNAKFPPPSRLSMAYRADHRWAGDDFFGASLQAWIDALPGYRLVSCNLSGVNAFFVREDLASRFVLYEPGELYQPARYWLTGAHGHPASLRWLAARVADQRQKHSA